eukprot:scaffold40518_cov107-Phaeocystis_antarctica.AAC.2
MKSKQSKSRDNPGKCGTLCCRRFDSDTQTRLRAARARGCIRAPRYFGPHPYELELTRLGVCKATNGHGTHGFTRPREASATNVIVEPSRPKGYL